MGEPLRAHTINEVRYYLMVTVCQACGKGPRILDAIQPPGKSGQYARAETHCKNCQDRQDVDFICDEELTPSAPESDIISPTDEPSPTIDLGQWLSLFYLLVETAATETSPPLTRRLGFRAALCLAEGLKFFGPDDELPPESAFFTPDTLAAFRKHPEKFAKQKLRDMQAKLPSMGTMARRVARDEESRRRRWWQFWR